MFIRSDYEGCLWDNYDDGYCCVVNASKNQIEETRNDRDYDDHKYRES